MEPKDSNSSKIKIILLDIFPSFEDLENQDKKGLSIIFHGINKFYNLKELISQKEEIIISPNLTQTKMAISIIQNTDILATGQMIIKHGTQWVTFSYENKEKSSQGNLVLNLIDCIKINILCEIPTKNQINTKKRNNSIEFPDKKDNKLNLNKKFENFKKMGKNYKINRKNHNNSQENYNNELVESYNYFNATVKKKNSNDFSLNIQILSTITKEHNKKFEIYNSNNNNVNNSLNCLYKQFNYNNKNLYSLKKLNTEKYLNNKKFKKRINNSAMNISGSETKTSNYNQNLNNSNVKSTSRSKIDKKEENNGSLLSSTLKNFNFKNIRKKNNTFRKYLSSSENENNPNFQNYSINIDEILSNKIREHVNVEKSYNKGNCINSLFDKSKIKKVNNNTNSFHLNNKLSSNGLAHAKTKTTNFINVNLNNNELSKTKNEKKQKSKIRFSKNKDNTNMNKTNYNINNSQKFFSNNNSIKTKKNNNFNLEISTNCFAEEKDKNKEINFNKNNGLNLYSKDKKVNYTISTRKNKKIIFNKEASSQSNNFMVHLNNNDKSPNSKNLSDRNTEKIINDYITNDNENENGNVNKNEIGNDKENEIGNDNENEYNAYEKIKEDFNLVYNDEYIKNIQEDLLKLEIELFIEKITELIKSYHNQIDLYNLEHEIVKNNYRNNVRQYLFQWKLYNKLQYLKMTRESKIINPFENKKQIKKNNINKVDINQKEMVIFKTLFSDNNEDRKRILKRIILNALENNDKNIKPLLKDFKFKNWMQKNINDFQK